MREQALFQTGDEDSVKFQAFSGVHAHQLQSILAFARLMATGFERGMREERIERAFIIFLGKQRRGVDQFVEVFQPVGAFLVQPVKIGQT